MISETVTEIPNAPVSCTVAIGTFDGVHRGHRQLLTMAVDDARRHGRQSVVLTFDPHPLAVLKPELAPRLLMTADQRMAAIAALGVDRLIVIRFTPAFAAEPAVQFAKRDLRERLGAERVFIGFNFSFGRNGEGTAERLAAFGKQFGFAVTVLPPVVADGRVVSSSAIRRAVMAGEMESAATMLGRSYSLTGKVVHGDARGRTLGFPTANIALAEALVRPRPGVYVTRVSWRGRQLNGVANFGLRPTFRGQDERLEVHLLDSDDDWYDRLVEVEFLHCLRGERSLRNGEELQQQIGRDVEAARAFLAAYGGEGLQAAAAVVE